MRAIRYGAVNIGFIAIYNCLSQSAMRAIRYGVGCWYGCCTDARSQSAMRAIRYGENQENCFIDPGKFRRNPLCVQLDMELQISDYADWQLPKSQSAMRAIRYGAKERSYTGTLGALSQSAMRAIRYGVRDIDAIQRTLNESRNPLCVQLDMESGIFFFGSIIL